MRVSIKISAKKDLAAGALIVGRSGSGKSLLLMTLAYNLIRQSNGNRKHAVMVIDPHGDLGRACMSFAMQDKTRLFYLSTAINGEAKTEQDFTCVFNPFISDGSAEMRYLLTETLTESLCELLVDATLTIQMISIIRPCIATVLRSPKPSLATLNRFFLEGHNQDLIELGKTSDVEQHRIFFTHEWNAENLRVSKNSLRVKLSFFLSDQRLANMLNGTSTIHLEAELQKGSVIILNLPKGSGSFTSKVMGKLMLAYLHALMLRRDSMEQSARRPLYLIVDEFASIVTTSLATSLAETRKYGMSAILAVQSLGQIENTTIRKTVMVNTGLKATGLTDHQDRLTFSKELSIDIHELERLRPKQFFLKRNDGRYKAFKFDVPIISKAYMLTKKEKKALLDWLVYKSGQYVPVPPPAPLPAHSGRRSDTPKPQKNKPNNTTPDDVLKPAF